MTLTSKRIELEAARWLVRHRAGPLTERDKTEFEAWLATSPRHLGAYTRARAASAYIDRFVMLAGGKSFASKNTADLRHPSRRWLIAASAAALLIASMAGWLARGKQGEAYRTQVGELREVALSDGSNLRLNTDSQMIVHFDHARREVRLERGETMFDVAKDVTRPFIVEVAEVSVKAIGTSFSIRRDGGDVEVLVTQGMVEVTRPGISDNSASRRIAARERLIVTKAGASIETLPPEKEERLLAWRAGVVSFDGEPLSDAIAEINRYNRRHIILDDPLLASRPIVGIFRTTDVESFVSAVAPAFGADVQVQGDTIRLKRKPNPAVSGLL